MHEPLLRRAANPAPYRILGLIMRPFSLGHALLLTQEAEKDMPMEVALAAAVWICSSSWRENRSPGFWAGIKMELWKRRCRRARFDYELQRQAFERYVAAGSLYFPLSDIIVTRPTAGDGLPSGAPFLLRLQQFLMMKLGLSEEAAWDYPYGLAKMRLACHLESEGAVNIKSESEEAFDLAAEQERNKGGSPCQV